MSSIREILEQYAKQPNNAEGREATAIATAQLEALMLEERIDELKVVKVEAYHSPFNNPGTNYDVIVNKHISELEAQRKEKS